MTPEFVFIGHCFDPDKNHDKIWGYFLRPTPAPDPQFSNRGWLQSAPTKSQGWNCIIFWARRGKALQFKADKTGWDLAKFATEKQYKKGYKRISPERLQEIWPTFTQECEEKLMWDILAGKVK